MTRSDPMIIRSTTILCLRKDHHVAMGSDGQVTHGTTIMKQNAKKLRRMYNDTVLAGFAGATADAFTLFEKFEGKLQEYRGNLTRDRKSTRLNSSHSQISYAVFCLKKKKNTHRQMQEGKIRAAPTMQVY